MEKQSNTTDHLVNNDVSLNARWYRKLKILVCYYTKESREMSV